MDTYNSENEADSHPQRAVLIPSADQGPSGAPLMLEVDISGQAQAPSCVPLCAVTNPRSGWNKLNNLCTFLRQISPDIPVVSEHLSRNRPFKNSLNSQYWVIPCQDKEKKGQHQKITFL